MEKGNILLVALLVAVIGVLGYALFGVLSGGSNADSGAAVQYNYGSNVAQAAPSSSAAMRTSDEGQVSVDITPKKFDGGKIYFDIGVNTHSVDLSKFELKEITLLETDGKKLYPEFAPPLTGHHNSGQLVFSVKEEPKEYRIIITGLAAAGERVFSWP